MVNGVPRQVPRPKPEGPQARRFWPWDLLRHSIHHDTPKGFPYNIILPASRTSKEGFLSVNGLPREYHGQFLSFAGRTLVELNTKILVRDGDRMGNILG